MGGWWIEVDGLVLPKPLGGHPALELCNTRSGWGEPADPRQEYVRSYAHLVVATREAGLVSAERAEVLLERRETRASDREVDRVRALRADAHAALTGAAGPTALARLARAAAEARGRQELADDGGRVRWRFRGAPRVGEPVDAFALAVGDLLVSDLAARVARCPGHGCGWLFLDTSGRRRWCQMAVCGNRAKQARVRER